MKDSPKNTPPVFEQSAGAVLVRGTGREARALLIRIRREGYEVPKGHVEPDEGIEDTALRELREETALLSPARILGSLGTLEYQFERRGVPVWKRVRYFRAVPHPAGEVQLGKLPQGTREVRWVSPAELPELPLVSEELRGIISEALASGNDPGR